MFVVRGMWRWLYLLGVVGRCTRRGPMVGMCRGFPQPTTGARGGRVWLRMSSWSVSPTARRSASRPPAGLVGDDAAVVDRPGGGPRRRLAPTRGRRASTSICALSPSTTSAGGRHAAAERPRRHGRPPVGALVACARPTAGVGDRRWRHRGGGRGVAGNGCAVVGGDLSRRRPLVVAVTVPGTSRGRRRCRSRGAAGRRHLRHRAAAARRRPGCGLAAGAKAAGAGTARDGAGGGHRRPRARLAEGEAARRPGPRP